jgi:hypothetical protein
MTGFEYSAAILMLYVGMVSQGVELIENIRRRYDGERRNPWDEAECGYFYARPMASWAAILALSGFRYDAAQKSVEAKPRINRERFSSFWSTGSGWGSFSQLVKPKQARFSLSMAAGRLACRSVTLVWQQATGATSSARLGGRPLSHQLHRSGNEVAFVFSEELVLKAGDQVVLSL